jgi:8-oxo-dGTP pyrophosphatase MutT (NUDIX family)
MPPALPPLAGDLPEVRAGATIPAAVLVAVTDRTEPGLLLTVRHERLRTHAGQIAFAGGRAEPGEDPTSAAVREAQEELGLDPSKLEVVGTIEDYLTVTGFVITPVIAVIDPEQPLTPHEPEVSDWFEAPLAFLLDPANQQRKFRMLGEVRRDYWAMPYQERYIWGATAAMLMILDRTLRASA